MGAWDAGPFDNDDAMDWVAELEAEGMPAAGGAIQAVLDHAVDEYLEAPVASQALAAAEVVAALRGQPAPELPEDVQGWLAEHPGDPGDELVAAARAAVARVLRQSELAELWEESEEAGTWRAATEDLRRRLS